MKKFITNNWKKILIFIGSIFIIINVFSKISTDTTLLNDYIKYGKDIEKPGILENVGGAVNLPDAPFGPEIMKIAGFIIGGILLVIILTTIVEKASAKPKKK